MTTTYIESIAIRRDLVLRLVPVVTLSVGKVKDRATNCGVTLAVQSNTSIGASKKASISDR